MTAWDADPGLDDGPALEDDGDRDWERERGWLDEGTDSDSFSKGMVGTGGTSDWLRWPGGRGRGRYGLEPLLEEEGLLPKYDDDESTLGVKPLVDEPCADAEPSLASV